MNATQEQWRPVIGHEGAYEVSDYGHVRSLDRVITFPNGRTRRAKGKVLKAQIHTSGYYFVQIGHGNNCFIHDLVLEAFVGPKPRGNDVRHGPFGPLNNSLVNLCYGTRSDNEYDKVRDGTHQQARKTRCPEGHLYDGVGRRPSGTYRYCKRCKNAGERQRYTKKRMRGVAA